MPSTFAPSPITTTPQLAPIGGEEEGFLHWLMSSLMANWGGGEEGDGDGNLKQWSSFIGIIVAISGNVLISLALNVQKYAHVRIRREKAVRRKMLRLRRRQLAWKRVTENGNENGSVNGNGNGVAGQGVGAEGERLGEEEGEDEFLERLGGDETPEGEREGDGLLGEERLGERSRLMDGDAKQGSQAPPYENGDQMYLHSPWWWLGLVLMTVGECGNFLAYGFAPASIVSPLGVVALISNCMIAPLLLKEPFRGRDFLGVVVSISGAVIVVMSSAPEEVKVANPLLTSSFFYPC